MESRKVLLLENVAAQAAGVREKLVSSGYQVAIARYESDGLLKFRNWSPEIVVLSAAFTQGGLLDYCRRLKADPSRALFLVVTASVSRQRLCANHPGLEPLIDAFLLRPYGPDDLMRVLRRVSGQPEGETASRPAPEKKLVVVLDQDRSVHETLRKNLEPQGIEVLVTERDAVKSVCRTRRPQVLILGWPVPDDFFTEVLGEVQTQAGGRSLPVLLLSSAGQDVISRQSPALLQAVDMLFTKPIAWEYFFRVLSRLLETPADREPKAPVRTPATGDEELASRFQQELEAKYLEVEELKHRLAETEKSAAAKVSVSPEGEAFREENRRLRDEMRHIRKKAELDLAKKTLEETELEVKLDNLLRMKDESERRSQDLLNSSRVELEELQRELAEVREAEQTLRRDNTDLRADLERALVEKEQAEESIQAGAFSWEGEKERLREEGRPAGEVREVGKEEDQEREEQRQREEDLIAERRRAEDQEAAVAELTAKNKALEADVLRERDFRAENEARWDAELTGWREKCEEREREVAELRQRCVERDEESRGAREKLKRLEEELGAERRRAEDQEAAVTELNSRNKALETDLLRERELREEKETRRTDELDGWKAKDDERQEEILTLRKRCAQLEEQENSAGQELKEHLSRIRELEAEKETREKEIAEIHARSDEKELQRLQEEGELDRLRKECRALRESVRETEERCREQEKEKETLASRFRQTERDLAAVKGAKKAMEEEYQLQLLEESERSKLLGRQLEEASQKAEEAAAGGEEYQRVQQLLQEVITRAQQEVVERTRQEMELESRLRTAQEEKNSIQERFEKIQAEASEREKRLTALLEHSLARSPETLPVPAAVPEDHPAPAVSGREEREQDHLPTMVSYLGEPPGPAAGRRLALVAGIVTVLAGTAVWFFLRGLPRPGPPEIKTETAAAPVTQEASANRLKGPRETWEKWTRSDVSGGVLLQATLRSEEEIQAEIEAEKRAQGWSEEEAEKEYRRILKPYRFDENFYFYLYLKNLQPGYPSYLENINSRIRLRDDQGREVRAFFPAGQEEDRTLYSFTSGELSKGRGELIYESTVPVAFSRKELSPAPSFIQLMVYDVGATSRRVLTWEME